MSPFDGEKVGNKEKKGKYLFSLFLFFQTASSEKKNVFETANRYHFIHTLALCAVPMTRRPALVSFT